jgi:hypothetical protein
MLRSPLVSARRRHLDQAAIGAHLEVGLTIFCAEQGKLLRREPQVGWRPQQCQGMKGRCGSVVRGSGAPIARADSKSVPQGLSWRRADVGLRGNRFPLWIPSPPQRLLRPAIGAASSRRFRSAECCSAEISTRRHRTPPCTDRAITKSTQSNGTRADQKQDLNASIQRQGRAVHQGPAEGRRHPMSRISGFPRDLATDNGERRRIASDDLNPERRLVALLSE